MKISISWLSQYYNAGISANEIANVLTDTGLEIGGMETFETVEGGLNGLVIGKVLTVKKHPNADRLSVATVDTGNGEPAQIVCGAPNVAENQHVVVALPGAVLFPVEGESFKIKKGKIRGEESNGMICAEDEIGLGSGHDGIMVLDKKARVGMNAAEYFQVQSDTVLEVDLTPNRSDAFSHIGVARDLLAALKSGDKASASDSILWPDVSAFKVDNNSRPLEIQVVDYEACPRYTGLTVSGINVGESPDWLQNRLKSIGLKPINNIVDITNFILHEMGQPLHAFDADKISGNKVIVKKLPADTSFITLDEEERKLSAEDLMICNASGGMCMAGVFGGISSGVTNETKAIFIESAYFNPVGIRKTAKRHGLNTDASFRYERGTDPNITVYALKRAAMLVKEIAGGEISSEITDVYPHPVNNTEVSFSFENCDRLVGQSIERQKIRSILSALDIEILSENGSVLMLSIPPYRTDVKREADVIEEVLRIYGYNNIGMPENLRSAVSFSRGISKENVQQLVSNHLSASGFNEILSNSLTKSSYYPENGDSLVRILNPLSMELDVMRQSLLFGALEALLYNRNRKTGLGRFYEFGKVYSKTGEGNEEKVRLLLMMSGNREVENWNHSDKEIEFYDLKKYIQLVFDRIGIKSEKITTTEADGKIFEYGVRYEMNNKPLVEYGKLNIQFNKQFDITGSVYYADLDWEYLLKLAGKYKIEYQPIPKFPVVRRDLALLLDETVKFEQIEQIARQSERKLLRSVQLFDVYQGKGLDKGKKSYAVSFYFRSDEKTLKDEQVDKSIKQIYQQLTRETGATLRQGTI